MNWREDYFRRFYSARRDWTDGTSEFHELCRRQLGAGANMLEVGSGPSNPTSRFLATLGTLHGVDVTPELLDNDALARAWVFSDDAYPVEDEVYDAAVSNWVVEHIDNPATHLREVARVLKPGGAYVFRTPNIYHYVTGISALTPHWFHRLVANAVRGKAGEAHEPYPTVYAMNSESAVERHAVEAGFLVAHIELVEKEPSYMAFSRLAFLLGVGYERLVNSSHALRSLRSAMFVVLRKPPVDR